MRTKASLGGHPIHPMLAVFPVALFTAGLVALIVYMASHDAFWFRASYLAMLAGGALGIFAAVFGLIDLAFVPRDSRAKAIGAVHAGAAAMSTALFLGAGFMMQAAWHERVTGSEFSIGVPLALAIAGFLLVTLVGRLGWQLIGAHHVGVSPVPGRNGRIELVGELHHPEPEPERATHRAREIGAHT